MRRMASLEPSLARVLFLGALVLYVPLFAPRLVSDGAMYHEMLRSLVYDSDLNLDNEREFYTWQYVPLFPTYGVGDAFKDTGYPKSLFNIGPALFWSPLFIVAKGLAWLLHELDPAIDNDGYSFPERLSVAITSLPLAIGGMLLTLRLLRTFRSGATPPSSSDPVLAEDLTLCLPATVVMVLASPLPAFVLVAPTFSHPLSYLLTSAFLVVGLETFGRTRSREQDLLLGLCAGLAALVRTQCLFLLVLLALEPVARLRAAAERRREALALLRSYGRIGAAAFLAFSPQLASNLVMFGKLMTDPQGEGGMRWLSPQLGRMMTDAKSGLLTTSPFLVLAALGLPLLLRRDAPRGAALLLTFSVQLYLNAVRRDPLGVGFGMRRFIEVLPLLTLGFAELLWLVRARRALVAAGLLAGGLLSAWNLLLMAQYYLSDLSQPWARLTRLQIAQRNLALAPQLVAGLARRGLLAESLSHPPAQRLIELLLFGAALALVYLALVMIERGYAILVDLFPVLVVALGAAFITADVFLLYSRLATREIQAFALGDSGGGLSASPGAAPPAAASQGPDLITHRRHLTLRRDAFYEGLLSGGFVLRKDRAAQISVRPTYPGGILDEGVLSSTLHAARHPVLRVEAGGLQCTGLDIVLGYERYDSLPQEVLEARIMVAVGGSLSESTLRVIKTPETKSFGVVGADAGKPWPPHVLYPERAQSLHVPFARPLDVRELQLSSQDEDGGLTVRGLALQTARGR